MPQPTQVLCAIPLPGKPGQHERCYRVILRGEIIARKILLQLLYKVRYDVQKSGVLPIGKSNHKLKFKGGRKYKKRTTSASFSPHLWLEEASDADDRSARSPKIRPAPIACCEAGVTNAPARPTATAAQKANCSSCEMLLLLLLRLLMPLIIFMLELFTWRDSARPLTEGHKSPG